MLVLEFGRNGNAAAHLGAGWSVAEDGFRWMLGEASELWLEHPGAGRDCVLELTLNPLVRPPVLPQQRLQVRVRGLEVGQGQLAAGAVLGFHIPASILSATGPVRIELLHPDARQPSTLGASDDTRCLSLLVRSARLWRLPETATAAHRPDVPDAALLAQFESLGESAAFATAQRQLGHEPTGLFGFAHMELHHLLIALRAGFVGFGDPAALQRLDGPNDRQYRLRDTRSACNFNTRLAKDQTPEIGLLEQTATRMQSLGQQLLEDMRTGGKYFVITRDRPLHVAEILPLFCTLNAAAANQLLWVVPPDDAHPAGTVQCVLPGLLKGHVDQQPEPEDWLQLCHNAWSCVGDAVADTPMTASTPAVIGKAAAPGRRILFLGNCQLETLALVYQGLIGADATDHVSYLASYRDAGEAQRRAVADADVLVQQVQDFVPQIGNLPTRGTVHLVPHVTGAFLWPYAGDAHPRNVPEPWLDEGGPYPAELGDGFLNRMLAQGVSDDVAVRRYRDTDIARQRRVDRLMELYLNKQRQRDQACGYSFADQIAARFRHEFLFRTPNHLATGMALSFASEVFARMGVPDEMLAQLLAQPPDAIFPPSEAPVHPSVAAHFALDYAPPERGYRYFNEGRFSFEEFAGRYMRFEWNAPLAEGLYLLRARQIEAGVARLIESLPTAPRSAHGRFVLADALARLGRLEEAARYAQQARRIEPDDERFARRAADLTERWQRQQVRG